MEELSTKGIADLKKFLSEASNLFGSGEKMKNFDADLNSVTKSFKLPNDPSLEIDENADLPVTESELFDFDSLEKIIEENLPSTGALMDMLPDIDGTFKFNLPSG